ncbi:MAG: VWA domain-containing protein, partial [Clostridia bacterium]|nr:VWA domain-containing protein [Clostridia bacterium]
MKNIKRKTNKMLSLILVLTIVFSMFSGLSLVNAATANPYYNKVADNDTLDGWRTFFGTTAPSTENAGGVWTDKSVFADNSAFTGLTDAYDDVIVPTVDDDSFLVALSAIASNKSIVGYSHIPTDTVLVLDISGSMGPDNNDAVSDLVLAANAALTKLLELNNNNRVGVVLYSAEYSEGNDEHYYTLLPIDRYSATGTVTYDNGTANDTSDDIVVDEYLVAEDITEEVQVNQGGPGSGRPGNGQGTTTVTRVVGEGIAVADGVKNSSNADASTDAIEVIGGTFIQGGLKAAADLFKGRYDANDTIIKGDGFQGGTQRKPVLVLMSDGAPTYASTNFTNPANPNLGTGHNTYESYAFLTQLTAAYVKEQ